MFLNIVNCKLLYIYIYIWLYIIELIWWLDYMFIYNHFGWNETNVLGLKGNQGTMVTYVFIWLRTIELIWYVIWVNDEYIY